MNLSKICIDPRLRNGWQAIDLGTVLALRWYKALFISWMIPSLIVFVALTVIFYRYNWIAALVVWWLKPLWDRLPLALASRALFSEPLHVKASLRQCFSIFKRDWFSWLTWRRLNPTRSFDMPVTVLEGLQGATRSRRLTVLHQTASNSALWLTVVGLGLELVVIYSMVLLVNTMIPSEIHFDIYDLDFNEYFPRITLVLSIMAYCAMALVAPFYAVGGFVLYISRRIELEGWDIEIRFRHLMDKLNQDQQGKKEFKSKPRREDLPNGAVKNIVLAMILPLFVAGALCSAPQSHAQEQKPSLDQLQEQQQEQQQERQQEKEPEFVSQYYQELEQSPSASEAKREITEVLSGEDFHRTRLEKGWREIPKQEENPEDMDATVKLIEQIVKLFAPIRRLFTGAASGFEILVWLLIVAVVAYLIYRYRDALSAMASFAKPRTKADDKPQVLFGLDVRQDSLPEDVPQQVLNLWRAGKSREAIGLLYRATLSRLIHQFSFEFYDGYTEQECVSAVRVGNNASVSEYLVQLTRVWQYLAYAHQQPGTAEVEALCSRWPQLFNRDVSNRNASKTTAEVRV